MAGMGRKLTAAMRGLVTPVRRRRLVLLKSLIDSTLVRDKSVLLDLPKQAVGVGRNPLHLSNGRCRGRRPPRVYQRTIAVNLPIQQHLGPSMWPIGASAFDSRTG
jgi:hypothetical protein